MRAVPLLVAVTLLLPQAAGAVRDVAGGGLADLARRQRWDLVLQVASRRSEQLPLSPGEAMVAAVAARAEGEVDAETRYLEVAAADPVLAPLVAVRRGEILLPTDPAAAVAGVVPVIEDPPSSELFEAALAVAVAGVEAGIPPDLGRRLERLVRRLPSTRRRLLELAFSLAEDPVDSHRLVRILQDSTRDLVALSAAGAFPSAGGDAAGRWLVAQALFDHALYGEAAKLLEPLMDARHRDVPLWKVAFLRGRCAFRMERLSDAEGWYREAARRAPTADDRSDLERHLARTHELAGAGDEAVKAAKRALRFDPDDDLRLFLLRLLLWQDRFPEAQAVLSELRGSRARARGRLLVALDQLRRGETEAARAELAHVRQAPWKAPAAVIGAGLAIGGDEPRVALDLLDDAAAGLGPYWASRARELVAAMPEELVARWRADVHEEVRSSSGRTKRRAIGRWVTLDPAASALTGLVREATGLQVPVEPRFADGLAAILWRHGLEEHAVRWDPGGLPGGDAGELLWSATQYLESGAPWLAIRRADTAWRRAGSEIPSRAFPIPLRHALYPLPLGELVHAVARREEVLWTLIAGVTREESRWAPDALSVVGARGLMQLMPLTARQVALRRGESPPAPEELFVPSTSLALGASELARLLESFGGRAAPAVAAYNAGEAQARLWLEGCGNGCSEERYVATITFSVTRRYTEDVLAAADEYGQLYPGAPGEGVTAGTVGSPGEPGPGRSTTRSGR